MPEIVHKGEDSRPRIGAQIESLETSVEKLEKEVETIESMLHPILGPSKKEAESLDELIENSYCSPLLNRLIVLNGRVQGLRLKLEDIMSRCSL